MSDWPLKTLEDVCLKITDGAHHSPKSVTVGKPMASVKDLTRFGVDFSKARLISEEDFCKLVKQGCRPEVGDVLIAKDGNSALDTVCNIKKTLDAVLLSSVAILRPDPKQIDSDFLKYYLTSKTTIDYLKSNFISGAAIPRVILKNFKKAEIKPPPLDEQKKISSILSLLDDKIELNHQINQTLEQIAQAIFKSWFVDFEPVKAKIQARRALTPALSQRERELILNRAAMCAISGKTDAELDVFLEASSPEQRQQLTATAALFPDELEDTDLGAIPKGWEVSKFGEVSNCFDSKRIPLSKRQREEKQGDIPYYGATSVMDYVDNHLFDGIFLLLGEDGSVLREDGTPFIQYVWGKSWINNHAHVLQGKNGISTEHLMIFVQRHNITAYVTGAVQLKLNQKNMNSIPFIKAATEINEKFYSFIEPLYAKYRQGVEGVASLVGIRDSLLPKLLSGELRIENSELRMENVG